jgi:hypothetical protein
MGAAQLYCNLGPEANAGIHGNQSQVLGLPSHCVRNDGLPREAAGGLVAQPICGVMRSKLVATGRSNNVALWHTTPFAK